MKRLQCGEKGRRGGGRDRRIKDRRTPISYAAKGRESETQRTPSSVERHNCPPVSEFTFHFFRSQTGRRMQNSQLEGRDVNTNRIGIHHIWFERKKQNLSCDTGGLLCILVCRPRECIMFLLLLLLPSLPSVLSLSSRALQFSGPHARARRLYSRRRWQDHHAAAAAAATDAAFCAKIAC